MVLTILITIIWGSLAALHSSQKIGVIRRNMRLYHPYDTCSLITQKNQALLINPSLMQLTNLVHLRLTGNAKGLF